MNVCRAVKVIQEPLTDGFGVLRCDLDDGHDSDEDLHNLHHDRFQGVFWFPENDENTQEAMIRAEPSPFPPVKEEKNEQQFASVVSGHFTAAS